MHDLHDLSQKQWAILRAIQEYLQTQGYPPGLRDIGRAVGVTSLGDIHYHLSALERMGYIARTPGAARGLRLLPKAHETLTPREVRTKEAHA